MSPGHFKSQSQPLPNGESVQMPAYIGEHNESLPESAALLEAATIIGSTFGKEHYPTLRELVDTVGNILTQPKSEHTEGIIIEDEEHTRSISISIDRTVVSVYGQAPVEVSSSLMFDMLFSWARSGQV